ncbi:MAG TPA: ubiquinol-cytochrome c reductase iron-sulfur subunit [Dissulfurispiraceae bacterium]|nr:ubiquinol-cytochrome c reductase iron-sulfur subunit [Dissulfurispiraceae bacterium]
MNECERCTSGPEAPQQSETTRRRFLIAMVGAASLLLSAILEIPFIGALVRSRFASKKETWTKVADLQAVPEGLPVRLNFVQREEDAFIERNEVRSVWIVRGSGLKIAAYSPICPHAGCYYNWNEALRQFECPCHGSVFKIDGSVVSGPSPRHLDTLPVRIENGALFVMWERFKAGVAEKLSV